MGCFHAFCPCCPCAYRGWAQKFADLRVRAVSSTAKTLVPLVPIHGSLLASLDCTTIIICRI